MCGYGRAQYAKTALSLLQNSLANINSEWTHYRNIESTAALFDIAKMPSNRLTYVCAVMRHNEYLWITGRD